MISFWGRSGYMRFFVAIYFKAFLKFTGLVGGADGGRSVWG